MARGSHVTPHFHSLVPNGVFVPREGGVRFEPLPPPTQAEVKRLFTHLHAKWFSCFYSLSHPARAWALS